MGDSPFFGYSAKWGYRNTRKPTQSANICSFIQRLNLQNSTVTQVMARIWHNSWPWKVDNHLTSFVASSSTSFGWRDAESISITNIPLRKSFSKPRWLPLKLGWPLGRPSTPFSPPENLVFRLGLIRPLGRNGVTYASLGMIASPLCGTSCPPCTSWISLMNDGAAASLPFWGFPDILKLCFIITPSKR